MIEYCYDVYSQNGEDGLIEELLNRIKDVPKYFVEFGGWDGFHCSNVANLRENKGWDGVMFELDGNRVLSSPNIKLYDQAITSKNINSVFKKYKVPFNFGVLSIDIDGDDYYVWKKLKKEYKPAIVVIEYNFALSNDIPMVYEEQGLSQNKENVHNNYFNCNMLAMVYLGISKQYTPVEVINCNIIFVRNDLVKQTGIKKLSAKDFIKKHETKELSEMRALKTDNVKNRTWLHL